MDIKTLSVSPDNHISTTLTPNLYNVNKYPLSIVQIFFCQFAGDNEMSKGQYEVLSTGFFLSIKTKKIVNEKKVIQI